MHHEFNWHPIIGDPTFVGWFTVVLYFIAAWRCGVLAYAMYRDNFVNPREFVAWLLMTLLFVFLGINKQLDLQSAVTEIGRVLLYRPDRVAYKEEVQFGFIVLASILAAVATIVIVSLIWRTHPGTWIGCLGTIMVILYVLIRATSFHNIDAFIQSTPIYNLKWNWIIEISGIMTVLLGTLMRSRALSRESRRVRVVAQ